MQETFSIGINGKDCAKKKKELKAAAKESGKGSVSKYLLALHEENQKKQPKKAVRE
jgi:hypothetical protein